MLHHASTAPRALIDDLTYSDEATALANLRSLAALSEDDRQAIATQAADLVRAIRTHARPGLMEVFLAEYGLSTDEGIALMCLAEALLRVPDAATIDALIEDKIAPSDWSRHLGHASSPLVNASTWALMLTGRVLDTKAKSPAYHLRTAIKRVGEPVIRAAVGRAMKEMGSQFVLGETISAAMKRGAKMEAKGYTYSYDMLGEAARTHEDAQRYFNAYSEAIRAIATAATSNDIRRNPGISVKLSALYPRYDELQAETAKDALVPRLRTLCQMARDARIGLNIDAEEADRLALSLDIIEETLADDSLADWQGFGVVVQAYGKRAPAVIDWLHALATRLDRKIMIRLVKGAYWDSEIKRAQVAGLTAFPVFTSKPATDVSYIANARKLLSLTDRLYPQFATHNAHTAASILHMASEMRVPSNAYEFQRLHGMGEALHDIVKTRNKTACRIYAPVGAHRDLLAYLVRRLLENGANSSFVNQIVDEDVAPEVVAADPFAAPTPTPLPTGADLFDGRANSKGFDLRHRPTLAAIETARNALATHQWQATPLTMSPSDGAVDPVLNPSDPEDTVGQIQWATEAQARTAAQTAHPWAAAPEERARILNAAADLYEAHYGELFALLHREAGKSLPDAVAELREAVDFLRYYASQATGDAPRGTFACISPWNFPLAIFTGQIAAALAAGNAVLAKPAEQTPLIAFRATQLLHEAGVPQEALHLLPGAGDIGAALTSAPQVAGVAFTGGTETAQIIHRSMAAHLDPGAPLIAETGGLNAMIVDSTALPEQAVQAIVESAFQSAGQRCSALRCLYVQEDVADTLLTMLKGAMDALTLGNPWHPATDVGPVIDQEALDTITNHVEQARAEGRLLHALETPKNGLFAAPALIRIKGIEDLNREIFGPVLHVATFKARDLKKVIKAINATGYGLTFGLHTRIDDRVEMVTNAIEAGNIYVNRNQIGAIVGSQPFGGEGLSGTGPKAGGPHYLARFRAQPAPECDPEPLPPIDPEHAQLALQHAARQQAQPLRQTLPGPTGEANVLSTRPRPPVLCLGPGRDAVEQQAQAVRALGGHPCPLHGALDPQALAALDGFSAAIWWGDQEMAQAARMALATRPGPITTLITGMPDAAHVLMERHTCIDTTAAGGNAALLAGQP